MKISYQWICDELGQEIELAKLCEDLTSLGLEVGNVEAVAPQFTGVVVAEILQAEKHPNADKLRLCKVSDGHEPLKIVCGAPNACSGIKVALSKVGAVLPNNFKIKRSKIRGIESEGMLCSAKELGLGAEHDDGIIELDSNAKLGMNLRELLALDDSIIDIELTPNRGDCFSLRGILRDLNALYGRSLKQSSNLNTSTLENSIPVQIDAKEACWRFSGVLVKESDFNALTPQWMQNRLLASGGRSLNLVVDITNYVMLELGQPLHAYDARFVESGIRVRYAEPGEKITLLDGSEIELSSEYLVIANNDSKGSKALGLAGIMGGENCKITDKTQAIYFEAAHFSPSYALGKARSLGMQTDASLRFERGVDPTITQRALARAVELLVSIAGGLASEVSDLKSNDIGEFAREITFEVAKAKSHLGVDFDFDKSEKKLTNLGFSITKKSNYEYLVGIPWYRFDIQISEDIYEEVARFIGYHKFIDSSIRLSSSVVPTQINPNFTKRQCAELLAHLGLQECITFSFVDEAMQSLFFDSSPLKLQNPIASGLNSMRLSLLPGLFEVARYNLNHQATNPLLFELAKCFIPQVGSIEGLAQITQQNHVAGLLVKEWVAQHWQNVKKIDFFVVKGIVERLFKQSGIFDDISFSNKDLPHYAHPHQAAIIRYKDSGIGIIGMAHPKLLKQLSITEQVGFFEIQSDYLFQHNSVKQYQDLSAYPFVLRDLALVISEDVNYADLTNYVNSWRIKYLSGVEVFDVYLGEGLPQGRKSIALRFKFINHSETFTEESINQMMSKVIDNLKQKFSVTVRS